MSLEWHIAIHGCMLSSIVFHLLTIFFETTEPILSKLGA